MNQAVHTPPKRSAGKPKSKSKASPKVASRTNDPERTMADIIDVATHEFSEKGLAGARIDVIAEAMRTSKRMIYYYFGSKEGLYIAVLEEAYRRIRHIETELHLEDLRPEDALRKLVGFTVDYQLANPDFVRLVMAENMQRGNYLAQSALIQELNVPAISAIDKLYARGVAEGAFRTGLSPIDIHASISALTFFNVSNQHTFGLIFERDLESPGALMARRDSIIEMVVRFVRK